MALDEGGVQVLLGRIVALLENEGALIIGVRQEFKLIKEEFQSMQSFLRDADRRSETDHEAETWVAQVRDAAYNVEDIIDEFSYRLDGQWSRGFLTGILNQIVKFPKNTWVKHDLASKLQEIVADIVKIRERHDRYNNLPAQEEEWLRSQHSSSPLSAEYDVVGMDGYEKKLLGWLQQQSGEVQPSIISVSGMPGSGKTTIVAKVYNNEEVKKHFQCSAWITVSRTFVVDNLFRCMIKEFYKKERNLLPPDLDKMGNNELVETIRDYLQGKRYVIVLDDVWNLDLDFDLWNHIKAAIPFPSSYGSAIMLTTRKEDVAHFPFRLGRHYPLPIAPLPENKAWELFCRRAFLSYPNRHCPQQLEPTARDLVKKCRGLPLTIVVMGSLMSSKEKTELEWKRVCNSPNWELSNNDKLERAKRILLLSFHDLPYRLKHCFIYCCVFPEDYLIQRKRLIRLWIAEGFVEKIEGKTLEDVADTYLEELVCRSMLEVVTKNHFGRTKRVRLHDLMRELGLSISKKEKFCAVYNSGEGEVSGGARHLAMHKCDKTIPPCFDQSKLRSFFVFATETTMLSQSSYELPKKFKFLRVLDLQDVPIAILPNEIVELFSLRYLNLRKTGIKEVPKALGMLQNLQTLDISDTEVETLPKSVVHLQNLRNLLMYHYHLKNSFDSVRGKQVTFDISKLENLQVLASVEADIDVITQLGRMTQLRRIGITKVRAIQVQQLCDTIRRLNLLRSLFLMARNEYELLQMDTLERPPPHLQRLTLVGKLKSVPNWFGSLNDLTFLFLKHSKLSRWEDPLSKIHALRNLRRLSLSNAYEGNRLHFKTMWFPMLKMLRLWNLSQLNEVIIEDGAMPDIEELWLGGCRKLLMLPQGIKYLRKLKELTLDDMPDQFVNRLRGEGSSINDRRTIAHIPQINHYYWKSSRMHQESLSRFYKDSPFRKCGNALLCISHSQACLLGFRCFITEQFLLWLVSLSLMLTPLWMHHEHLETSTEFESMSGLATSSTLQAEE